ncbi:nucleoside hydrolase [Bacillus carboniphilus]|uniref:Nucleoside hydrolase n=1 Tax=Bacillus carboniphilus TaxID=86663 RepID=A0ABY9JSW9_9BACI|nr:nucleoside hydrolase [Bacillus carboniphilus]WLR42447.1 nucleoside hydrolase [Bacillus carboniphilus]
MRNQKNVLAFSDFGIDDVITLLYAYYSEEINLVGIVADYGNISFEAAMTNVKFIQNLTGVTDVPIISGAVSSLTGQEPHYFTNIHGPFGLGPIIPQIETNHVIDENFYLINEIIERYKNDLYILSTGRLTSLATAFVLYPKTMSEVKEFYVMGGAFNVPGNVTPVAEANYFGDPYAANLLIQLAPKPVYLIPLDVTEYALVTTPMINQLTLFYKGQNDSVGQIIKPLFDYYNDFYKKNYPSMNGSPLHDTFTLWAISDSGKKNIYYEETPTFINTTRGESFGQSSGDFRKIVNKANWPVHNIALWFDYRAFINEFFLVMTTPRE